MNENSKKYCVPQVDEYDKRVEERGYLAPEVAFGMMYEFIEPGQRLLDIGIGTARASLPFFKAGLRICGMDVSTEMFDECKRKGLVAEFLEHDLNVAPYPYAASSFDHVISIGVLNHFENLSVVFEQTSLILRKGGCFTFMVNDCNETDGRSLSPCLNSSVNNTKMKFSGHSEVIIKKYLNGNHFTCVRKLCIPVSMYVNDKSFSFSKIYVCKKN